MKKITIAASLILLSVISGVAQSECTRHVETKGGFSYCPPPGWYSKEPIDGGQYMTFRIQDEIAQKAGFGANLNVKDGMTNASNDEVVVAALIALFAENEKPGPEAKKISLVGLTKVSTISGLKGSRIVLQTEYKGWLIRTIQFLIDLPDRKLILTGTSLVSDKSTIDPLFDGVARSVKLIVKQ